MDQQRQKLRCNTRESTRSICLRPAFNFQLYLVVLRNAPYIAQFNILVILRYFELIFQQSLGFCPRGECHSKLLITHRGTRLFITGICATLLGTNLLIVEQERRAAIGNNRS